MKYLTFSRGHLKFTCCIIDEATQCTELESLLPIQLGIEKFVLVGDPQQLPAVVCNKVEFAKISLVMFRNLLMLDCVLSVRIE